MCDSLTNSILITGFTNSPISSGSTVTLTLESVEVRNPPSSRPSSPVTISTYSGGLLFDSDSTTTVLATAALITVASVTPGSFVAGRLRANYVFSITPPGYVI